jgi:serine/threonine-protein kinase
LVWNFTPLPEWVAQGKSFWDAASSWISEAWKWVSTIGDQASNAGGPQGPGGP